MRGHWYCARAGLSHRPRRMRFDVTYLGERECLSYMRAPLHSVSLGTRQPSDTSHFEHQCCNGVPRFKCSPTVHIQPATDAIKTIEINHSLPRLLCQATRSNSADNPHCRGKCAPRPELLQNHSICACASFDIHLNHPEHPSQWPKSQVVRASNMQWLEKRP